MEVLGPLEAPQTSVVIFMLMEVALEVVEAMLPRVLVVEVVALLEPVVLAQLVYQVMEH